MNNWPSSILFLSDKTEVSLKEVLNGTKEPMAIYSYVKCHKDGILKNTEVSLGMAQIERLLLSKLIEIK